MTARIFGIAGSTNSAEDFRLSAGGLFVPASALNDRTGITSVPVLTGTGNLTATVGPFSCLIDGTSNSLQGSYWVTLDTATTVTIGAGNSQPRIDLISMQILDNAYDSSGQQKAQLVVTAGTPSGSPSAPAAPANSISLWTISVPALATSVTWSGATAVFPYTAAVGGIVFVRNSGDQPAVANGVQYRHRGDVAGAAGSTSPLEWSVDGTTWHPVFDASVVPASTAAVTSFGTWTDFTPSGSATLGSPHFQWRTAPGSMIQLRGKLNLAGGLAAGTYAMGSVGAAAQPASRRDFPFIYNVDSGTFGVGIVQLDFSGALSVNFPTAYSAGGNMNFDGVTYSL